MPINSVTCTVCGYTTSRDDANEWLRYWQYSDKKGREMPYWVCPHCDNDAAYDVVQRVHAKRERER
jgi:YgiT-type zinc finger domain-containing protein